MRLQICSTRRDSIVIALAIVGCAVATGCVTAGRTSAGGAATTRMAMTSSMRETNFALPYSAKAIIQGTRAALDEWGVENIESSFSELDGALRVRTPAGHQIEIIAEPRDERTTDVLVRTDLNEYAAGHLYDAIKGGAAKVEPARAPAKPPAATGGLFGNGNGNFGSSISAVLTPADTIRAVTEGLRDADITAVEPGKADQFVATLKAHVESGMVVTVQAQRSGAQQCEVAITFENANQPNSSYVLDRIENAVRHAEIAANPKPTTAAATMKKD